MIDLIKSIQVSETICRLLQKAIDTGTVFKNFDLFNQFDKVKSDLDKHELYSNIKNLKLSEYKWELNYPNVSIERLEENYNKIHKLIMLRYA